MAALRLFVFTLFLCLVLTDADGSMPDADGGPRSNGLDQLSSKIRSLENRIEEKIREMKEKDALIDAKERTIKEQSQNIASLESEVASLREKGNSNAVAEANARAGELEKQVEKLKKDLAIQIKDKERLEARVIEVGKKSSELNSKADKHGKIVDEQKTKLRKTERALQIAEEQMMKAKFEAASKAKELMEVHGAWFPPWMALQLTYYQSLLEKKWKVHGKPAMEPWIQKIVEKKARAEQWVAPHVETVRTKWLPSVKGKWANNVEPHLQRLTRKTIEMYEVSKNAATPNFIKVVELVDPYYQGLRRVSRPYIDRVATAAKPHVTRLRVALHPYTKGPVRAYGKFLESATTYHYQVQDRVHEKLRSHELTKSLATKELVWFAASALLALPFMFLFRICSAVFCKKEKKPSRRNGSSKR
ncbi:hypothetical protein C2S52_002734 [Perilla frutescens var. hirtella]|uniref:Uncharacterized protein n=1 Tax=Perilla frutescens var. hirtella TaxID=608512 RepID=A0AAD4JCF8_PERFH|nr:hypothetical protein C2S51_012718 [Perilla frutescens var. frutescens]KAH6792257.1 hypothetical protein C2S52_002734 [Perilla frutescens var. hirtella]KAH6831241.1 hypothetical protein C2S53_009436 [Perilla frutescens var. hirtella]